jgi:hypothetical protein
MHRANPRFWSSYRQLSKDIQRVKDRCYKLLLQDPHHPSLHFKKVGRFWIGSHGDFSDLLSRS